MISLPPRHASSHETLAHAAPDMRRESAVHLEPDAFPAATPMTCIVFHRSQGDASGIKLLRCRAISDDDGIRKMAAQGFHAELH